MKQGTKSIICGCHSPIHSIIVTISWKKIYGKWPKFWQLVCIFLHDIGHYGLDYLDNFEEKKIHWKLGAKIGGLIYGNKGYNFLAGHCDYSNRSRSALYKADKYSWLIAPRWWLWLNIIAEPKLQMKYKSKKEAIDALKTWVKRSVESEEYVSTHEMYLNHKEE
jgi:hypothetical protein